MDFFINIILMTAARIVSSIRNSYVYVHVTNLH